jgi:hypothetical protein
MDLREIGLEGYGLDSTVSGQGPVAGCCECGDEPLGSCATELVSSWKANAYAYAVAKYNKRHDCVSRILQPRKRVSCERNACGLRCHSLREEVSPAW